MARTIQSNMWVLMLKTDWASINGGSIVSTFDKGSVYSIPTHIARCFIEKGSAEETTEPKEEEVNVDDDEKYRLLLIKEIKDQYGVEMDEDSPVSILIEQKEKLSQKTEKDERASIIERVKENYGVSLHPNSSLETLRKKEAELSSKAK